MRLFFFFAGAEVDVHSVIAYGKHGATVEWGTENYAFVPYRSLYIDLV